MGVVMDSLAHGAHMGVVTDSLAPHMLTHDTHAPNQPECCGAQVFTPIDVIDHDSNVSMIVEHGGKTPQ